MSTEAFRLPNSDDALVKARRRQIFLAACRVLARKSFHQATVKEIALEAGLAAGSIYLYLRNKEEILLLLAESMVTEAAEAMPPAGASDDDPRRLILGIMRAALDVIDRYREAFAVLNHEVRYLARRPQYRARLELILEPYLGPLGRAIKTARDRELMEFDDAASVVEAVHMLCSGWAMGTGILANTDKEGYWAEIVRIIDGRLFATAASQPVLGMAGRG